MMQEKRLGVQKGTARKGGATNQSHVGVESTRIRRNNVQPLASLKSDWGGRERLDHWMLTRGAGRGESARQQTDTTLLEVKGEVLERKS